METKEIKDFKLPNDFFSEPNGRGAKPKLKLDAAVLDKAIPHLHNRQASHHEIIEETPDHRSICLLKCEGFSSKEIAERTGYSQSWVNVLLKQSWAEKFILETIHSNAQDGLERLYKKFEAEALDIAHTIMADETNPPKLRKDTAVELMKIARGQRITIEDNRMSLEDLQKEEEIVQAKLNAALGKPNVTGAS